MAPPKENEEDLPVELDEEGAVTVELSDEQLAAEAEADAKKPEPPEEKKPIPRKRLAPEATVTDAPVENETTKALQESLERAEAARRAAEATAAAERRRATEQAERASRLQTEAEDARDVAEQNQMAALNNSIEAAERELASYQTEHERAMEAGEFAKVSSLQVKISQTAARLDRFSNQKETLANAPKRVAPEQTQQTTQPPAEQYLSQFSPEAQSWLRAHPDCLPPQVGGTASNNAKMMAGHYAAIANNVVINSPEYFKTLDEHVSGRKAEAEAPPPTTTTAPARKALPAAPPSRETPSATPGIPRNVRQVVLSKEQREMAKMSFPQLPEQQAYAQYARNLVDLQAEGKIGRTTH